MATKCIVLGQPEQEKKGKPIEFVKYLSRELDISVVSSTQYPRNWQNAVLMTKDYLDTGYDVIYAYDGDDPLYPKHHCFFLGHWNDGFVE